MKNVILFLFLVSVASCQEQVAQSTVVSVEDFKAMVLDKEVQLVDVRTQDEFSEGHIEGAVNIDYLEDDTFVEKFESFDKNKPVYIYCRSGNRSQKAGKLLQELGFMDIIDLEGGYDAWIEKN